MRLRASGLHPAPRSDAGTAFREQPDRQIDRRVDAGLWIFEFGGRLVTFASSDGKRYPIPYDPAPASTNVPGQVYTSLSSRRRKLLESLDYRMSIPRLEYFSCDHIKPQIQTQKHLNSHSAFSSSIILLQGLTQVCFNDLQSSHPRLCSPP